MITWIFSSTVLILTVLGLRFSLKEHIRARVRYALWALVLLRLLIPWNLGSTALSMMNRLEQTDLVRQAEAVQPFERIEHTATGAVEGYGQDRAPTIVIPQASAAEFERMETVLTLRDVLIPVWLLGLALMGAVFLASNLTFRRRVSKTRMSLDRADSLLPVYASDGVESPCLFGLFRPAIYLPTAVIGNDLVTKHALAHELTHYRHGDHIWAMLRCLALTVHWYNPLVWLAAFLSRRDGELACDEGTLDRLGDAERIPYGQTLLELTCPRHDSLFHTATTMTGGKRTLRERITYIAKGPRSLWLATLAVILVASLTAACTMTGPQETTAPPPQTTTPETTEHNCTNYTIVERMTTLKEEDIFWENSDQQYPEVVPALNAAAEHPVPTPDESHYYYSMELYLNDDCTTGLSHFLLYACTEENVVQIRYQNPAGELYEKYFESEELYRIIRNHGHRTIIMYQADYEQYRAEIDGVATRIINEHLDTAGEPIFSDFNVVQFQPVDRFDGHTVYEWEAAFTVADGKDCPLAGKMYLDSLGRIRGIIEQTYFVVKDDGETRFFYWDLYAQEQDDVKNTIREAFGRESFIPIISTEPPTTIPDLPGTPLTPEEVEQVNEAFSLVLYDEDGRDLGANPICCFLTSYYDTVEELNFEEFMRYFPGDANRFSEAEFHALKQLEDFPYKDIETVADMPVPIHRYYRETVDDVLMRYAGITTEALDTSAVAYLKKYDSYYNDTSDFGLGAFHCTAGTVDGDTLYLYSAHSILTLEQSGDTYHIRSHQPIE